MFSEQERCAIRRHAKVIEDYEANREHEFRRIIAPIWGRAEAIWRQINDERLRSPEGFEAFTYVAEQLTLYRLEAGRFASRLKARLTLYRLEAGRFASRLKARLKGTEENPSDPRHLIR